MGEQPAVDQPRPRVPEAQPGPRHRSRREAAATLLSLSRVSDVIEHADRLHRPRQGRDGVRRRQGRPVGHEGQPELQEDQAADAASGRCSTTTSRRPSSECRQQNPAPYFTQLAAPVTSLRKIAEAVLDAWPNVQTKCERSTRHRPVEDRPHRPAGRRHPLHARRRQPRRRRAASACDEAQPRDHAGTLRRARPTPRWPRRVALAEPARAATSPFTLDMADVRQGRTAYPGTMIVYTAATTANLAEGRRRQGRQFIRIATTEGQRPGYGNGELPAGLPADRGRPASPRRCSSRRQASPTAIATQKRHGRRRQRRRHRRRHRQRRRVRHRPTPAPAASPTSDAARAGSRPDRGTDGTGKARQGQAGQDPEARAGGDARHRARSRPPVAGRLLPLLLVLALLGALRRPACCGSRLRRRRDDDDA